MTADHPKRTGELVERLALASIRRAGQGDVDAGIELLDAALVLRRLGQDAAGRGGRSFLGSTTAYSLATARE